MPYTIDWLIPEHVIYVEVYGDSTEESTRELSDDITEFVNAHSLVHLVINTTTIGKYTPNPVDMLRNIKSGWGSMPNFGWAVVIGRQTKILAFLVEFVRSALGIRISLQKNVPDAIEFLTSKDESIPIERK